MTREERQLLLKDLCARLPYEVILLSPNEKITYQTDGNTAAEVLVEEGWKPYLRPMSSMTKEEQQKYYDLTHQEEDDVWGKCLFDKMVDFCNENHLDYRGLIEMGLALEATKDIYKED